MAQRRSQLHRGLLTTSGLVLVALDRNPDASYAEMAKFAGVDERTVTRSIEDLIAGGYLTREGRGRAVKHHISRSAPIAPPIVRGPVHRLLQALTAEDPD